MTKSLNRKAALAKLLQQTLDAGCRDGMPDSSSGRTLTDLSILFVFKVGHSVQRKSRVTSGRTHHWRCYVDSWNPRYPLSNFVTKVTFKLHDTFDNPRQVVRQAPFAIEEDGFGNFQLQIEVTFFGGVTNFCYNLILFDHNDLPEYHTVRIDPPPDNWDKMIQLGGDLSSPRTSSSDSDAHEPMDLDELHEQRGGWSRDRSTMVSIDGLRQQRANHSQSQPPPTSLQTSPPPPPVPTPNQPPVISTQRQPPYSNSDGDYHDNPMLPMDRFLNQRPLLQKHKKKLQLLHEAQLLMEDAQKQQTQWGPSAQTHHSPIPNSPQYHLAPSSPTMSIEPYRPSPVSQPLNRGSESNIDFGQSEVPVSFRLTSAQDHHLHYPQTGSVSRLYDSVRRHSPIHSPGSKATPPEDSDSNPGKRIVLKLSRLGAGNQLTVSSTHLDDSISAAKAERLERRRRKKERHEQKMLLLKQKQQQQQLLQQNQEQPLRPESLAMSNIIRTPTSSEHVEEERSMTRLDTTSSTLSMQQQHSRHHHHHHHHYHTQSLHRSHTDTIPDGSLANTTSDISSLSPRKSTKLKRHKRSKSSRDRVEPPPAPPQPPPTHGSEFSQPLGAHVSYREDRSDSIQPNVPTHRSEPQRHVRIRNLLDTDPLDHYEEGNENHTNVSSRHIDEESMPDAVAGTRSSGPSNRYADHSHLLLEQDEHELDDVLPRSLFSQCHDSTNPDSPFVDMFGEETQMQSDASMQSSDDGPGSNLPSRPRTTNPAALFDSDADSDDRDTDKSKTHDKSVTVPAPALDPKPSGDVSRGIRVSNKLPEPKTSSRGQPQPDPESNGTKKNAGSSGKFSSMTSKDRMKDESEQGGKSVGTVS
ncbi:unnamed protein product [Echinostoma caproni]|uniref:C2 domain-containing protein n=1 Tax=Echinostoma caproni TaxID=27848 RepID=A0A183AUK3_9TREM|nr:unnamed protein product [Echinostoma caproni]